MPQAFLSCLGVSIVAFFLGTTAIPLPWTDGLSSTALTMNCFFAVVYLAVMASPFTSNLFALEEFAAGAHSWLVADTLRILALFAPSLLLALLGNAGMLQYLLLSSAVFFALALMMPTHHALTTIVSFTVLQCFGGAVIVPERLPIYWDFQWPITGGSALIAALLFVAARRKIKKNALFA